MQLFKVNFNEFEKLKDLSKEEYGNFMEQKMLEAKEDIRYRKYKFVSNNELYRFFEYPPYMETENEIIRYIETKAQTKKRLDMKAKYKDMFSENVRRKENESKKIIFDELNNGIAIGDAEKMLGLTRKTFLNIQDANGENNFKTYIENRKIYVDKESLINYLNKRHYESTFIKMENLYLNFKHLLSNLEINRDEIEELLHSEEYISKKNCYFETVKENERVCRISIKTVFKGIELIDKKELSNISDNFFEKYNPNLKICSDKIDYIPKLYTINYWAAILGVTTKTILRYCDFGYIKHYRIGARCMISSEDFKESIKNLEKREKEYKRNKHIGRKKKIELFFTDDIFERKEFKEKMAENKKFIKITELNKEKIALKDKIEKENEILKTIKNPKEIESFYRIIQKEEAKLALTEKKLVKNKRDLIAEIISDETFLTEIQKEINEYNEILSSIKKYGKDLIKAKREDEKEIATQLEYIISEFTGKLELKKNDILNKILKKEE